MKPLSALVLGVGSAGLVAVAMIGTTSEPVALFLVLVIGFSVTMTALWW